MKRILLFLTLIFLPACVFAQMVTPAQTAFLRIKHCVMLNDNGYCRAQLAENSYDMYNRFSGYKLMPCLPTDFTYAGEEQSEDAVTVKATMQAGGGKMYVARLVFVNSKRGMVLDIPRTLRRGFGDNWENRLELAEQLYLMMKQNMGDKLTCDQLNSLVIPGQK